MPKDARPAAAEPVAFRSKAGSRNLASSAASVARNYYHHMITFAATIHIGLLENSGGLMARWLINSVPCIYLELPDKLSVCEELIERLIQNLLKVYVFATLTHQNVDSSVCSMAPPRLLTGA